MTGAETVKSSVPPIPNVLYRPNTGNEFSFMDKILPKLKFPARAIDSAFFMASAMASWRAWFSISVLSSIAKESSETELTPLWTTPANISPAFSKSLIFTDTVWFMEYPTISGGGQGLTEEFLPMGQEKY